jgi:hypothetical protein
MTRRRPGPTPSKSDVVAAPCNPVQRGTLTETNGVRKH